MQEKLNFDVSFQGEKGTLTILKGQAPEQPKIIPQNVRIEGNILAPLNYYDLRKHLFQTDEVHVLYNQANGTIELMMGENLPYNSMVKGRLLINPELTALGINSYNAMDKAELIKILRLKRHLFFSAEVHTKLLDQLRNMQSKLTTIIDDTNDQKGNKRDMIERKLEQSVDLKFVLVMPIYAGLNPEEFEVNILIDYQGGDTIMYYLESHDLVTKMENIKQEIITKELAGFGEEIVKICVG